MKKLTDITTRREFIRSGKTVLGASSLFLMKSSLLGCAPNSFTTSTESATSNTVVGGLCSSEIPTETAGPYPAHDDSAINCLRLAGIVRSNIKSSLNTGGYLGTSTATGIPLSLTFTITESSTCAPLVGYAVYLWHCDINGKYSMYSSGVTSETYLRGVQATDSNGQVTFQTIFPGCYDGRYAHMHFEIYPSLSSAVDNGYAVKTSQLTFTSDVLTTVYNASGYSASKTNLAKISLATDNVFSDGVSLQTAAASGNNTTGYSANLIVGI